MARYTMEEYEKKIKHWGRDMPGALEAALQKGAEIVRREVVLKHMRPPKMPVGVGSQMNATLKPHTGDLRGSIMAYTKRRGTSIRGFISGGGASVKYAAVHEYGWPAHNIPARPYLRSSLAAKRTEILKGILRAMHESYRRAR